MCSMFYVLVRVVRGLDVQHPRALALQTLMTKWWWGAEMRGRLFTPGKNHDCLWRTHLHVCGGGHTSLHLWQKGPLPSMVAKAPPPIRGKQTSPSVWLQPPSIRSQIPFDKELRWRGWRGQCVLRATDVEFDNCGASLCTDYFNNKFCI